MPPPPPPLPLAESVVRRRRPLLRSCDDEGGCCSSAAESTAGASGVLVFFFGVGVFWSGKKVGGRSSRDEKKRLRHRLLSLSRPLASTFSSISHLHGWYTLEALGLLGLEDDQRKQACGEFFVGVE